MKVLIDHGSPFLLAHGGIQIQIEQTKRALERAGVEVDVVRWWDEAQRADVIHYFGVAPTVYLRLARAKGIRVVMTTVFSETCNRPEARLRVQGLAVQGILALPFGHGIKEHLPWRAISMGDCSVVGIEAERRVLELVYRQPRERTAVVPLGLSDAFLRAGAGSRGAGHLISVGTITEVKRSVELARLARRAQVPILFVGRPYSEASACWKEFSALIDGQWVLHRPHVEGEDEMIALLHAARGFVLYSRFENWSLAASEAAACGLPLLVPDLPWSRERFGAEAHYFGGHAGQDDAAALQRFFTASATLPAPRVRLHSWDEVAAMLRELYARVLAG